jgi:hypothetical protein
MGKELPGVMTRRPSEIIRESNGAVERLEKRLRKVIAALEDRVAQAEHRIENLSKRSS